MISRISNPIKSPPKTKLLLWALLFFTLILILLITAPVIANRLASIQQTSTWRQTTDPVFNLPPEEDGSIVVTLTSDRPIELASPNPDFIRVDANTFSTRFPWNWPASRPATFVNDLNEETMVEVIPGLVVPFEPLNHGIAVINITCDSTSLWDPETGIYTTGNHENFLQRGLDWEREANLEFYIPWLGKVVDEPIGLRINGGYGRYYHQKGLRFYFDDYGSSNHLEYPFFPTGPTEFERLIVRASRYDDFCLNSNLVETLFADLGHLSSRYRFVAMYLNREYWGAYSLRERLDHEFFLRTWDLGYQGLNLIKDGFTERGDGQGWWNFLDSFDQVQDPEDEDLLMRQDDLNANLFRFFTARNETEWNTHQAPADTRIWNTQAQQWLTMFRTLLGNPQFRSLFRSRLEHLLQGDMNTENLITRLNNLVNGQQPEIPAHAQRWQGFRSDWYQANAARTAQWITDRRSIFLAQADSFFTEFPAPEWSSHYDGLVINEYLASNSNGAQDESGDYADWIELFNAGSQTINLTGMFLSDNLSFTNQWEFPAVMLSPGAHLVVWCDNEPGQGPLHTNFKLSSSGEEIGLFAPLAFGNQAIDTKVFGPQTTNISEGRLPDGASTWAFLDPPTFNRANDDTSGLPDDTPTAMILSQNFPNPFNPGTQLNYELPRAGLVRINIFDVKGRQITTLVNEIKDAGQFFIKWQGMDGQGHRVPSGLYFARMEFEQQIQTRTMTLVR